MIRTSLILLAICSASQAATVSVVNYSYLNSPNSSYPDSSGTELTDGIDQTIAWGNGSAITVADVAPLVGWLNTNPSVQFNFSGSQFIDSATIWIADSDGAAGVGLPNTVTVRTPDSSFVRMLTIPTPSDATVSGTTVPITLVDLGVTASSLIIEADRAFQWTMFSEAQFSDTSPIPEPSSSLLVSLFFAGAALVRRRK